MINLVRSEWIKFRSVRSTVITLLVAGVIVVLVAVLSANSISNDSSFTCVPIEEGSAGDPSGGSSGTVSVDGSQVSPDAWIDCGEGFEVETLADRQTNLSGLTGGVTFAALIFGVLGVQIIGQEYRFNTIRPTFTAAPRRFRVLVAKLAVVSAACAAISVVMVAFCWAVGTTMLSNFVIDGTDRRIAWGIVVFSALWAMAGLGVGAIVRQPIAGILILVGESLILEGLVGGLFPSTTRWLPFTNGIQMTLRNDGFANDLRPLLEGGIYFGAVCAGLFVIGSVLANRRDA